MARLPHALPLAIALLATTGASRAIAQAARGESRIVRPVVAGRAMRAKTGGLVGRAPGQPVVILEAGLLTPLDTWSGIFDGIATLAPVVSYDRRGIGASEFDGDTQTLSHVTASLHALLAELKIAPPYILVGHSYGGILIRAFARQFPSEVAGLVYVDAPDTDLTQADLNRITPKGRGSLPNELDQLPQDLPPGMKAEIDNMRRLVSGDLTELNGLRPSSSIRSAVLMATGKFDRESDPTIQSIQQARLRLARNHEMEWALSTPEGLFLVTRHGGHNMHQDNPELTVQAIRHIISVTSPPATTPK